MQTTPFNPVEFLESDKEIAEYLSNAYDDPDPGLFINTAAPSLVPLFVTNPLTVV